MTRLRHFSKHFLQCFPVFLHEWMLLCSNSDQTWFSDASTSASPPLIRVFAVCMKKAWVLSYPLSAQRRLWADVQADLQSSLGAQSFYWFCHGLALTFWYSLGLELPHIAILMSEYPQHIFQEENMEIISQLSLNTLLICLTAAPNPASFLWKDHQSFSTLQPNIRCQHLKCKQF